MDRRKFLILLSGACAATVVSIPFMGALLDPLLSKKNNKWRKVGKADEFAVGTTNLVSFVNADPKPYSGTTDKTAAWLRRESPDRFLAFSVNCTHLGCPVRWEKDAEMFMCPCHGGAYYKDGSVAAGPPPKELQQYQVRVHEGNVEILTAPVPLTELND